MLLESLRTALATDSVVLTITDRQPNGVTHLDERGAWVATTRSLARGREAEFVLAWMIGLAWDYLSTHGQLTNAFLLDDHGLNVKRSSFVCALLARLPEVHVQSRRPIRLTTDARLHVLE